MSYRWKSGLSEKEMLIARRLSDFHWRKRRLSIAHTTELIHKAKEGDAKASALFRVLVQEMAK